MDELPGIVEVFNLVVPAQIRLRVISQVGTPLYHAVLPPAGESGANRSLAQAVAKSRRAQKAQETDDRPEETKTTGEQAGTAEEQAGKQAKAGKAEKAEKGGKADKTAAKSAAKGKASKKTEERVESAPVPAPSAAPAAVPALSALQAQVQDLEAERLMCVMNLEKARADEEQYAREVLLKTEASWKDAESAAQERLEGLKNQNIQQMLGAFAWETQNSRYSLKDYILRMQCVNETAAIRMPAFSSLMAGSNLCSLRYVQANRIQKALRRYVLAEADRFSEFLEGYNVSFDGEEDIDAFIALYDNDRAGKLAGMSGVRFADPASVIPKYDTEQTKELLGKYRDIYGAEEIRELIGTADLGGETLLFNPILARYGDRWFIVTVQGIAFSLLGADYQRQAFFTFPGTLEDYLRKLQQ